MREKMAMEIESLIATVTELTLKNNAIKDILDMKQTEWVSIERSMKENWPTIDWSIQEKNQFENLKDECVDASKALELTNPKGNNLFIYFYILL